MKTFDRSTYEAWKNEVVKLMPRYVTCPDCNGNGEGTCSHCGNDTECETCDGDGKITPTEFLTPEFYRRVMMFEMEKFDHWAKGDPIFTKDSKGRVIENHNPLNALVEEFQPKRVPFYSSPKIVLVLPITEQ